MILDQKLIFIFLTIVYLQGQVQDSQLGPHSPNILLIIILSLYYLNPLSTGIFWRQVDIFNFFSFLIYITKIPEFYENHEFLKNHYI